MADWIVAGDPDLDGIHKTPEFRLWATHHLGFDVPKDRPERLVDPDRFTVMMVKRGAEALAAKWRDRAGSQEVPAQELIGWWREENEIWVGIDRIVRERRSWRRRFQMLGKWRVGTRKTASRRSTSRMSPGDSGKKRKPLSSSFFASSSTQPLGPARRLVAG